jgi:hypothetical protein
MTNFSDLHGDSSDVLNIAQLGNPYGNTWYVDSTHAAKSDATGFGTDPDTPFATLDYAIGAATANNGDLILLAPGHAETKAAGSAWAADVAGVKIVGIGQGADRPTFSMTNTATVTTISAASVWLENVVLLAGVDSIVAPLTISGPDCTLKNVEFRAPAAVEFITPVITTATADRLTLDGCFLNGDGVSGDACTIGIALVGTEQACIKNCRFQGVFTTAAINFKTTKSLGVVIDNCVFENVGTALTKDVVESVVDCTFSVSNCFDMVGGYFFSGSDTSTLASDDTGSLGAALAIVDGLLDVPGTDGAADTTIRDVIGAKADTAHTGAVGVDNSLMRYVKQIVNAEIDNAAINAALPRCVEKTAAVVAGAADPIFTIAGGPVYAQIYGIVSTVIGNTPANMSLQEVVTNPSATVALNAAPVAIATDAVGTLYYNVGAGSNFTVVTAGFVLLDSVTVEPTWFLLPPGEVQALSSANPVGGAISWYCRYVPLSPSSVVTAAA